MNLITKEEKTQSFKKWWDSVPNGKVKDLKQRIIKECDISNSIFSHWINGNSEIPSLAYKQLMIISNNQILQWL